MRLFFILSLLANIFSNFLQQNCFARPLPQNVYWVILAGGSGTRLWPLSRLDKPKQFLNVTDRSLIQQAVDRLKSYPDFSQTHLFITLSSENSSQEQVLMNHIPEIEQVIVEPSRRDTAPAILLASMKIKQENPEAVMMFLPADPYIPFEHNEEFVRYLKASMDILEENPDKILLLGKKPTYPATGYGYIEYEQACSKQPNRACFHIAKFHEKPQLETAKSYIQKHNMLWNMGIFGGKAATFQSLYEEYAHDIYAGMKKYLHAQGAFSEIEKKSIDFAIMEPSSRDGKLLVLPVENFDWFDVGNVDVFLSIQSQYFEDHHLPKPKVVAYQAQNNKVYIQNPNKIVALIGLEGVCVVDTNDALLITKCQDAEKVKQVVDSMSQQKQYYQSFL